MATSFQTLSSVCFFTQNVRRYVWRRGLGQHDYRSYARVCYVDGNHFAYAGHALASGDVHEKANETARGSPPYELDIVFIFMFSFSDATRRTVYRYVRVLRDRDS